MIVGTRVRQRGTRLLGIVVASPNVRGPSELAVLWDGDNEPTIYGGGDPDEAIESNVMEV